MELNELLRLYGKHPTAKALGRMLASSAQRMYVGGNRGSSLAMAFASFADKQTSVSAGLLGLGNAMLPTRFSARKS